MILMNNNNIMSSHTNIISLGSSRTPLKITAMGIWDGGYFCRTSFRACTDSTEKRFHHLPIIQHHVAPGTVVWSDEWAAYNHVASLPNVSTHDVVNHSVEFVSPSGGHTQNVESYWNRIKIKLKRMRGCHEQQLASYLDEFVYRGMDGQLGSVLIQLSVILQPSTPCS